MSEKPTCVNCGGTSGELVPAERGSKQHRFSSACVDRLMRRNAILDAQTKELQARHPAPERPVSTDLRPITRGGAITIITTEDDDCRRLEWITMGQCAIHGRNNDSSVATIGARLPFGTTDFEHDSAYAFSIKVVGLAHSHTEYGMSHFTAYVAGPGDFRVPPPGYNPFLLPDTRACKRCVGDSAGHLIVPDNAYQPPHNEPLFAFMCGRKIEIATGVDPHE